MSTLPYSSSASFHSSDARAASAESLLISPSESSLFLLRKRFSVWIYYPAAVLLINRGGDPRSRYLSWHARHWAILNSETEYFSGVSGECRNHQLYQLMHSRRRYQGVAAIINQRLGAEQYAAAASSYLAEKEAALREQCVVFQEKLQEFAAEHQHEIENNTALRARFLELCMNMGVEPFMSRRSVWSQLLGLGEWYARLGFLVAQIALATRDWNGGVIRLTTLRRAIQRRLDVDTGSCEAQSKRSRQVSTEDIVRAVQTLDTLKAGFRILVVDDKKHDRYLVSGAASQVSFTADEKAVLQRARETGGQVWREDFSWEQVRWEQCLERMLELGILWIDDGAPDNHRRYWALGMISEPVEQFTGTSSTPVDFSGQ